MNTEKAVSTGVSLYTLAGWLSIFQAVIPGVGLFIEILSLSTSSGIIHLIAGFQVVGKLVGIIVLFMFRKLLNERHNFHKADTLIYGLIFCYVAAVLNGVAELVLISKFSFMDARLAIYVLSSLVSIVYAVRLLKLDSNLSGLLRPYVYSTIASGVCGVTIVLADYGSLLFMVSLIFLGIILIRAEAEPEFL